MGGDNGVSIEALTAGNLNPVRHLQVSVAGTIAPVVLFMTGLGAALAEFGAGADLARTSAAQERRYNDPDLILR